jgi:hypothetical protein
VGGVQPRVASGYPVAPVASGYPGARVAGTTANGGYAVVPYGYRAVPGVYGYSAVPGGATAGGGASQHSPTAAHRVVLIRPSAKGLHDPIVLGAGTNTSQPFTGLPLIAVIVAAIIVLVLGSVARLRLSASRP